MGILQQNDSCRREVRPNVGAINALEPQIGKLTDAELRAKTDEFRQRIQEHMSKFGGNGNQAGAADADSEDENDLDRLKRIGQEQDDALAEVMNEILPEAFAVVREGGRRVLNMRHFD